jgi:hypothetical protein
MTHKGVRLYQVGVILGYVLLGPGPQAPANLQTPSDIPSSVGISNAIAQTGSCLSSPGDICFVNGTPYEERRWQS